MEMVIDSDTTRVQVAEVKQMMAFEPAPCFLETLSIGLVLVHLQSLLFIGNTVEIQFWKFVTSGAQPAFLSCLPKHVVAQRLLGQARKIWSGQRPPKMRRKRKQEGDHPHREHKQRRQDASGPASAPAPMAIQDVQEQPRENSDGNLASEEGDHEDPNDNDCNSVIEVPNPREDELDDKQSKVGSCSSRASEASSTNNINFDSDGSIGSGPGNCIYG